MTCDTAVLGFYVIPRQPDESQTVGYMVFLVSRGKSTVVLRGTIVYRTYGTHKNLYIYLSYFTNYIWSYLLLRGAIVDGTYGTDKNRYI